MLESLVASLLNRFLGSYVQNFDPTQLNIGIWSGDVKLRNLELKREALDKFRLPVNVIQGHLGELVLQIPWSNLKNKPVKVVIENVFLLAEPQMEEEYNAEEEARRSHALKLERLQDLELLDQVPSSDSLSPEEIQKNKSFTESLVTKIIDNLQVTIKNIHLRYEDSFSVTGHPFALGFSLSEFSAVSTDEKWNPIFIQDETNTTRKLATLNSMSIYWDTDTKSILSDDPNSVISNFKHMFDGKDGNSSVPHQYILCPVSGIGRIVMKKYVESGGPKTKAQLIFEELGFVFDSDQYRDALSTAELFQSYNRTKEFKKWRPKSTPKEKPREWFQYAAKVVIEQIHRKNQEWSWSHMEKCREQRLEYIELYKLKQTGTLDADQTEKFNNLEWDLSYDDIRFYRSLAKIQLRKEKKRTKPAATEPQPQSNSWSSWIWGTPTDTSTNKENNDELTMTDEQRQELYDAIEWDGQEEPSITDVAKDMVILELETALRMGSFRIKQDPHGKGNEIAALFFNGFKANFFQRPDSFLTNISLQEFRVDDRSKDTLYEQIVTVKEISHTEEHKRNQIDEKDEAHGSMDPPSDVFFWLSFEKNPLDGSADSSLYLRTKSVTVFYNTKFLENVAKFFRPPANHLETVGAVMNAAGATVEGIRQQSRIGLEYVLEEHKTANIKLDLQAPLIVMPLDVNSYSTPCAIVDAGHISVLSDLVKPEVLEEVRGKQTQKYTENDWKQLESLMYDKFNLSLHDTQILIGSNVRDTMNIVHKNDLNNPAYVLGRVNMDFLLEVSILPEAISLTRFKLSGKLPLFRASMSDKKYKLLMQFIDAAIPDFSDSDIQDTSFESNVLNNYTNHPTYGNIDSGDDEYDTDNTTPAAPSTVTSNQTLSSREQKMFEFKFEVEKVELALHRCINERTLAEDNLVDMILEGFSLDFSYMELEMYANVRLRRLNIEDYVDKTSAPELRRIATSDMTEEDTKEGENVDEEARKTEKSKDEQTKDTQSTKYGREEAGGDMESTQTKDREDSSEETERKQHTCDSSNQTSSDVQSFHSPAADSSSLLPVFNDLFDVKYKRIKRANTAGTSNEISDQDIEVSLSTLKFTIAPKTFLTILDFIITTFTDGEAQSEPVTSTNEDTDIVPAAPEGGEIDVRVNLKSIIVTLNDDGIKLATLRLGQAVAGVRLVQESMKVQIRMGSVRLNDDMNSGSARDSMLRQLISFEGDELADFVFETFDTKDRKSEYDSSIYFHSGSLRINVVEEPMTEIVSFLSRFNQMKGLFDAARQAAMNQAAQIEAAGKTRFDVLVKAPIVVFPRASLSGQKCDTVTANLGEFYINNEIKEKEVGKEEQKIVKTSVNTINAGVRAVKMTSSFHFSNDIEQELEILDNLDLIFDIIYTDEYPGMKSSIVQIKSSLTDIQLNLTDVQFRSLVEISYAVPRIFSVDKSMNAQEMGELEEELRHNKHLNPLKRSPSTKQKMKPKSESKTQVISTEKVGSVDKVDFIFNVGAVSLALYSNTEGVDVNSINDKTLSEFSLNDTGAKFILHGDGSMESDLHIHSLTISDTRKHKDSMFPEIIPPVDHEEHQFMCRITRNSSGKQTDAMLTVDSPRMILALDYLFGIKEFIVFGTSGIGQTNDEDISGSSSEEASLLSDSISQDRANSLNSGTMTPSEQEPAKFYYHVNIIDASLVVLAEPEFKDSEAIVFKTEQLILSHGETVSLSISRVGMFLCKMNRFNQERLRILNDFSISASLDDRASKAQQKLTSVQISIEPLVLRLSVRDILLASSIMTKAAKLLQTSTENAESTKPTESGYRKRKNTLTNRPRIDKHGSNDDHQRGTLVIRGEELTADIDGMRLVIIGNAHELPIVDSCVKPFSVTARNWSSDLRIDASTEMFSNIYNISKSAWEPLVESWDIGFHLSRALSDGNTFIDVFSRKLMQVTVTSQTIQTLHELVDYISNHAGDEVVIKPRETSAPYRIKNETGYTITVGSEDSSRTETIKDGDEIPWEFIDWHELRENLSTDQQQAKLTVKLENSPFDAVTGVSATSVGEQLYILNPKTSKVSHRLACDVSIKESLKIICLRSAYNFKNKTNVDLELAILPARGKSRSGLGSGSVNSGSGLESGVKSNSNAGKWILKPGESRAIPIQNIQDDEIVIRPDKRFGYKWCNKGIFWKDFIARSPMVSLTCESNTAIDSLYYIQADSNFDKAVPLTRLYPFMTVTLSAPLEIVNLLPFDFKYRLYCKDTKKDWLNVLKKGEKSPVHVVSLDQLLLLSVEPSDAGYDKTEFAVINSHKLDEFKREGTLLTHRKIDGQRLKLGIHYYQPEGQTNYHVVIYSPYVILNKTGLDIQVATRVNSATSKVCTEQLLTGGEDTSETRTQIRSSLPLMWSFDTFNNRSNRAILRVANSQSSDSQSFEALGTVHEVVIPMKTGQSNVHVGLEISEGKGRYKLSKIITITPRFVIANKLGETIRLREPGASTADSVDIQARQVQGLNYLRKGNTQLIACLPSSKSQWSAPFDINNVGSTYVKLYRPTKGFLLLKVDILLEQATLFIHLSDAEKKWPYSVKNFTKYDFIFYQANPFVDEQGVEQNPHQPFTPIKYKIPSKSIMPYSWDYPAAPYRELVISCGGRERRVQLAEIGSLTPMKLHRVDNSSNRPAIVALDVIADGPTVTLVISDYNPETSMYQLRKGHGSSSSVNASASTSVGEAFNVVGQDEETHGITSIKLSFEGVGISLINRKPAELCYITLRGFETNLRSSALYDTFSLKMKWMQIDNQLFGGIFPVVLFPSVVPKSTEEMESHPSFSTSITRVKDDSHGVLYIKYATLLLQEMTFEMDEDFLFSLMEFIRQSFHEEDTDHLCDETLQLPEPLNDNSGADIYFEVLHVQPAQLDLSFVRTERINVEDRPSSEGTLTFFFNVLTMAIGNINDAPVKLNALILENVRTPLPLLRQTVETHYSQEFIYQIHKILGSADVLFNPVGLFNNISSGFMDMFYEPYQGYIHSDRPQDLGIGIAKGGVSFVKKTVFGVSDSIAKWTGSVSKGLALVTMDEKFQNRRRMQKNRNRPQHALYGLSNGATSFMDGLSSGVQGLAMSPIEGASREGTAGFFKGLGKGLVGLPTKTAVGIFDLASSLSEGVKNTTTVFDGNQIARIRTPRLIEHDGIVRPYDEREAIGQLWLKTVDDGAYFNDEYLAHVAMTREGIVVIVTFKRVLMMSTAKMASEWMVKFQDLQTIVMERAGIALVLRGGVQGPFIPLPSTDSRKYLYREMGVAVTEFNRKNQTLS